MLIDGSFERMVMSDIPFSALLGFVDSACCAKLGGASGLQKRSTHVGNVEPVAGPVSWRGESYGEAKASSTAAERADAQILWNAGIHWRRKDCPVIVRKERMVRTQRDEVLAGIVVPAASNPF